jgi:hypothetical protein
MQPFYSTLTGLAVIGIYVLWHRYTQACLRRERSIQERVTYMLWTMACQIQ